MAEWQNKKLDKNTLNSGNEYGVKDQLSLESVNGIVEGTLYAQEIAEQAKEKAENTVTKSEVEKVVDDKLVDFKGGSDAKITIKQNGVDVGFFKLNEVNDKIVDLGDIYKVTDIEQIDFNDDSPTVEKQGSDFVIRGTTTLTNYSYKMDGIESNMWLPLDTESFEIKDNKIATKSKTSSSTIISNLTALPAPTADSPDFVAVRDLNGGSKIYRKKVFTKTFDGKNLSGTTWKWNSTPMGKPRLSYGARKNFNLNFTANNMQYSQFSYRYNNTWTYVYYDDTAIVYNPDSGAYPSTQRAGYETISFINGTDATNTEFIGYLQSYATIQEDVLQYAYEELATIPQLDTKQDTLVSAENIKTINGESILGSGNIDIQGGSGTITWRTW